MRSRFPWLLTIWLMAGPVAAEPPAFSKLKSLVGAWKGEEADGSPVWLRYQLVANESALMEELRMGKTDPMVSFYYPDGEQILMTHYCLTRSQPRMRTDTIHPDLAEFGLRYVDATNVLQSTGGMMNAVRLKLTGATTLEQIWGASAVTETEVPVKYQRVTEAELEFDDPPPVPLGETLAEKALHRIGSYQGRWVGTGQGGYQVGLTVVPISGGTAVMETLELAPGSTMVTVYHLDGDQLMLTHYCSSKTQPRMRTAVIPADLSRFEFLPMDATNVLGSTAAFMKNLLFEPVDDDHFRMTWNQRVADTEALPLHFVRGRPTTGAFAVAPKGSADD